ncbi:MAG: stage III sporulation AC/AD family protein [Clostridia bacterium]|nr:stage III sporulation AC/AD family protein [Clostridia bacterium]
MILAQICGYGILFAALGFTLRGLGWRGTPLFAVAAGLVLLSGSLGTLRSSLSLFSGLSQIDGLSEGVASVLRILGLGYLSGLTADVCAELGETAVAKAVTLAGKFLILGITVPYLSDLLSAGLSLLS